MEKLFVYPDKQYEIRKTSLRGWTLVTEKIISISKLFFQQLYNFVSLLYPNCFSSRNGTKTFYNTNRIKNSIRRIMIFPSTFFLYFHFFRKRKIHDRKKFSRTRSLKKRRNRKPLKNIPVLICFHFQVSLGEIIQILMCMRHWHPCIALKITWVFISHFFNCWYPLCFGS